MPRRPLYPPNSRQRLASAKRQLLANGSVRLRTASAEADAAWLKAWAIGEKWEAEADAMSDGKRWTVSLWKTQTASPSEPAA